MSDKVFYSHYNPATGLYQTNKDHLRECAELSSEKCDISGLKYLVYISGLLHDCGKYSESWAEYFSKSIESQNSSEKLDHSTAGGILAEKLMPGSAAAEMAASAIYSHHGIQDFYNSEREKFLTDLRREKSSSLPVYECIENLISDIGEDELNEYAQKAVYESDSILNQAITDCSGTGAKYSNRDFIVGMYQRLLISFLIDADRRNTEDFMNNSKKFSEETASKELWSECLNNIERKIESLSDSKPINVLRRDISDICRQAANELKPRYILSVPTGAGKTLSSLRFAVANAKEFNKRRIIYAAPYQSITEQNADEIREALGRSDIVLEHHSSLIIGNEADQQRYDRLTEDWCSPVVVTTSVQLLNTLFSGRSGCIRRFQSLCNSIVILDEVQALPIKVTELLCLVVNFLSRYAGTVFVLCSATQPRFENLPNHFCMLPSLAMIPNQERFKEAFIRTEFHDDTDTCPKGMSIEDISNYIVKKAEKYGDVLFIANTKSCAKKVFEHVSNICPGYDVYHLSTNMYPKHRREVINALKNGGKRICISTQVVEAGVNLSFRCVIRSLAGLDSVIQAAGRCNRHAEFDMGHVFIVKMNSDAENVSSLKKIRTAQDVMKYVLDQYRRYNSENLRLDSEKYIDMYFKKLYSKLSAELNYPVRVDGVATTIVEMLSRNKDLCPERKKKVLCQSFKTAGEKFEVIEDDGKITLIIGEHEALKLIEALESLETPLAKKKLILRELQSYSVSVSEQFYKNVGNGISRAWDGRLIILDGRYYDPKTGVTEQPRMMPFLNIT